MISIVMPLYKVEPYIKDCLRSLENQYEQDFEVIIVNDGSPDNSAKIVQEFQQKSKLNIKLINQKNNGVSAARNTGIEYTQGDYICFVDSDDMLDRNYLSVLKNELEDTKAGVCICKSLSICEEDGSLRDFCDKHRYYKCEYSKEQALEKLLYKDISVGIWALMCRRETLGSLRFAEDYHYSEDLEMVWKIVASSKKIICIDAPLYCYRIRSGSAMSVMNKARLDGMKLFEALASFMKKSAPTFYPQYEQYGVACWVWSTLWQEAKYASSYRDFKARAKIYSPYEHLKKLYTYRKHLVAISSFLYLNLKPIYYWAVKIYKRNYRRAPQGSQF